MCLWMTSHWDFLSSYFSIYFYSPRVSALPFTTFLLSFPFSSSSSFFSCSCPILIYHYFPPLTSLSSHFLYVPLFVLSSPQPTTSYFSNVVSARHYHHLTDKKIRRKCPNPIAGKDSDIFLKIACIHLSIIFPSRLLSVTPSLSCPACSSPFLRPQIPRGSARSSRNERVKK